MVRQYLTVTALNRYLKFKFDNDQELQTLLIKAEISNFKRHSRGHLYLTLKDDQSQISAIMFVSSTKNLNFSPKDGDKVIVEGYVSVYEAYGTYQIYIQKMALDGIGDLYLAYEKLKSDLAASGLFSETHKLPIPKYPKAIGVITSPTGAAIRDIINVVNNRFPLTEIIVYPALVQGPMAKDSIVKMIEKANNDKLVDVLIIGRGGGSIEDLWSFNEEIVARAVYNSHIPIISAVGHETDFTIIDFVSDLRASTPSHAAELAVRNKRDVLEDIIDYSKRLRLALVNRYKQEKKRYLNIVETNIFKNPLRLTQSKEIAYANLTERLFQSRPDRLIALQKEKVNNLLKTIDSAYKYKVNRTNSNYLNLLEKLELVNPLNIMKKGFTIIKQDELIKKSINDIDELKEVSIIMHDGEIDCKILKMKGRENE